MAENNKGGILNKAEKLLRRRKTKVLQRLGKQEKTRDELLVEDCQRLEKQQEVASKFQKDLRSYIHSAKALAATSKHFYTTVAEAYESEWEKHAQVVEILKSMDMLWTDYIDKLQVQVLESLTKYLAHIPPMKAKVVKRGRKLIDYDNAKHNLEIQQNAKKKDEAKITKAQQDLEQMKKIYEDINSDLHLELPEFYNSRVNFYGNLFQNFFAVETVFHTETSKGSDQISSSAENLALKHAHSTYTLSRNTLSGNTPSGNTLSGNTLSGNTLSQNTAVHSNENLINDHSDNGHLDSVQESPQTDTPSPSCTVTSPTFQACQHLGDTDQKTYGTANADENKSDQMAKDVDKSNECIKGTHNKDCNSVKTIHEETVVTEITKTVVINVEAAKPMTDVSSTTNKVESSQSKTDENIKDSPDNKHIARVNRTDTRHSTHEEVVIVVYADTGKTYVQLLDTNISFANHSDTLLPKPNEPMIPCNTVQMVSSANKNIEKEVKVNGKLDILISEKVEPCGDVPPPPPLSPPPDEVQIVTEDEKYDGDICDENLQLEQPSDKPVASDLPHKYIYTVLATHAYLGEDDDELSFNAHDIIYVMEFDDPEEQDPGWLMGVSKTTGKKGVFPENFTKRVN